MSIKKDRVMIKLLRKLSGKRTHIANIATVAGTALAATGLGVDPLKLAAAAAGSVDAINSIVSAWDYGRNVDWGQVGIGGTVAVAGPFISSFFRELGKRGK
jgi:hypothetical protein